MQTTMKKKAVALAIASMACTPAAWAAKPGTPTLGEVLEASGISFSGYVDTSYTYLSGTGLFTGGTANRVFDTERNSFNLHALNLTASSLPSKGFGALADVSIGADARVIQAATAGAANDNVNFTQVYVNYAEGPLTVIAGKYNTLAGFEVIKSTDNLNFTRGILFGYAMPATHTGVRASFAAGDKMKFHAGINNGWDVLRDSTSEPNKTVELGAALNLITDLTLNAALYRGEEPGATGAPAGMRTLIDLVASYAVNKQLTVALNVDVGEQEDAVAAGTDAEWQGAAIFAGYTLNDKWKVAARLENFNDKDGFRTGVNTGAGGQKWKEATVTAAFLPSKNVELRAEVRTDRSDKEAFMQPEGTLKKSQNSFGVEALYKF